jgi:hypothetical protein
MNSILESFPIILLIGLVPCIPRWQNILQNQVDGKKTVKKCKRPRNVVVCSPMEYVAANYSTGSGRRSQRGLWFTIV